MINDLNDYQVKKLSMFINSDNDKYFLTMKGYWIVYLLNKKIINIKKHIKLSNMRISSSQEFLDLEDKGYIIGYRKIVESL